MDRIDALRAFGDAERTDPSAETVINGAPYRPAKASRGPAAAVRSAYREEYLREHGPDLDEWLNGTESGLEI